jgi:hypothetical protein
MSTKLNVLALVACSWCVLSCGNASTTEVTSNNLDSAYRAGYQQALSEKESPIVMAPDQHRPGHIETLSTVKVTSGGQSIVNYGVVEDDSTKAKYFFFNIDESGQQIAIKPNDKFFFERLAKAPKIKFQGECYELVYPIGVNLGPNDHSHPCEPKQYQHQ